MNKLLMEATDEETELLIAERMTYYETLSIEQLRRMIGGALSGVNHKAAYRAYINKLADGSINAKEK